MIYVVSDIHGCRECYEELLKKIQLTRKDTLYVLGNILDIGPEPISLLMDLSYEPNVIPILGDRDYLAYRMLKEVKHAPAAKGQVKAAAAQMKEWLATGGTSTLKEFMELEDEDQEWVLEYLEEFALFAEVEAGGRKYLLTHAGVADFRRGDSLDDCSPEQFLKGGMDRSVRIFPQHTVIYGHTPTECEIEKEPGYIGINCDCVHGGMLAAYCLDNGKTYYVPGYDENC